MMESKKISDVLEASPNLHEYARKLAALKLVGRTHKIAEFCKAARKRGIIGPDVKVTAAQFMSARGSSTILVFFEDEQKILDALERYVLKPKPAALLVKQISGLLAKIQLDIDEYAQYRADCMKIPDIEPPQEAGPLQRSDIPDFERYRLPSLHDSFLRKPYGWTAGGKHIISLRILLAEQTPSEEILDKAWDLYEVGRIMTE